MHQLLSSPPLNRSLKYLFLLAALVNCAASFSVAKGCDSGKCMCHDMTRTHEHGAWWTSTGNFAVCSYCSAEEADKVAHHCETLRNSLAKFYGFESRSSTWQPKCQVFFYPDKDRYGVVVGRAARETLGSSLVSPDMGVITSRRIDLRADVADYLNEVLPHELTHVLIADEFRNGLAPLWYDEGLALLADSPRKQSLHSRDLYDGLRNGNAFSLQELLNAKQYPPANRVGVFYGQCVAMARCLRDQRSPEKIHDFARRSQEVGANRALKESYGIEGMAELQRIWRSSLSAQAAIIPAHYSLHDPSE
jgi:hypothetical protein